MKELSRSRWREATVQLGNSWKGTDDSRLRWTVQFRAGVVPGFPSIREAAAAPD